MARKNLKNRFDSKCYVPVTLGVRGVRLGWTRLICPCSCVMWDVLLILRCSRTQVAFRLYFKKPSHLISWSRPQTLLCHKRDISLRLIPKKTRRKLREVACCVVCYCLLKKFRQFNFLKKIKRLLVCFLISSYIPQLIRIVLLIDFCLR